MMQLTNQMYDILRWVTQYLLPASGTLYFALATIWGLPYGEQVVGTITAVDTFLGVLLGISTSQYVKSETYGDGTLRIDPSNPERDVYRLEIRTPLDEIREKDSIKLKVKTDEKLM